jgi:hypothetical protein
LSASVSAAIYKHWIWLGVPVILAALVGLILLIRGVIVLMRESQIARMPLAESLEITFPEAGAVVLSTESPRFSRLFAHAAFELNGMNGERVPGHTTLFRMRSSKVSTVTMELMNYEIPRPGRYVLRIGGIQGPLENVTNHFVSFARPHRMQTIAFILGIVFTSCVFIASLVFFLMRLVGVQGNGQ